MNHSTLLTPEENRKLKQLVEEEGSLRAVAIVQMYLTDSRLQWKYFKTGVLTLEASVRYNRVSLCLYDLTITYDRQSWQHENHIGYVNGQLEVHGSDRETVEVLLKILGGRVTVNNEDEMDAVMDYIHSVGIDKVTNAINKIQDSQTAYSSVSQHDDVPPNTAHAPPSSTRIHLRQHPRNGEPHLHHKGRIPEKGSLHQIPAAAAAAAAAAVS
ncbi:hypothetical protein SprV_0100491600 [Sparganum proliferum]